MWIGLTIYGLFYGLEVCNPIKLNHSQAAGPDAHVVMTCES